MQLVKFDPVDEAEGDEEMELDQRDVNLNETAIDDGDIETYDAQGDEEAAEDGDENEDDEEEEEAEVEEEGKLFNF